MINVKLYLILLVTWEAGNYRLLVLTEISSGCSARWWFYWWCWIRVESKCAATGRACRIELGSTELCLEVGLTSYVFQSWSNWHWFLFFNIDFFFLFLECSSLATALNYWKEARPMKNSVDLLPSCLRWHNDATRASGFLSDCLHTPWIFSK